MPMDDIKPAWQRLAWPIVLIAFSLRPFLRASDLSWWRWALMALLVLWLLWVVIDLLTGLRLSRWIEDEGDAKPPEVGDDFHHFCLSHKVSPAIRLVLTHYLEGGNHYELPDGQESCPEVTTSEDALAACTAYRHSLREGSDAYIKILPLFQNAGSEEAAAHFYHCGVPLVAAHAREAFKPGAQPQAEFNGDDVFLLRLLVGYGHPDHLPFVHACSRDTKIAEHYQWGGIFNALSLSDPDAQKFIRDLSKELPVGYARMGLLDWANACLLETDSPLDRHPFDSENGRQALYQWLQDSDPENASYAISAAVALGLLTEPNADLFALTEAHPNHRVQLEGAWARGKRGEEGGFEKLTELCRDWRTGDVAGRYLEELGQEDRIPAEAQDPRFRAMADAAQWLEHPNELASLPDSLKIIDHRTLNWPPADNSPVTLTAMQWRKAEAWGKDKEESGVILGGSATWCFFSTPEEDESLSDIYARHCNWELRNEDAEDAPEDYTDLPHGRSLLEKANPGVDWTPTG